MDIEYRPTNRGKWLAEVWSDIGEIVLNGESRQVSFDENKYQLINQWCIDILGYHARTAYHVFEFKNKKDLEWFLLRWQ
jgi:hypothetical protein